MIGGHVSAIPTRGRGYLKTAAHELQKHMMVPVITAPAFGGMRPCQARGGPVMSQRLLSLKPRLPDARAAAAAWDVELAFPAANGQRIPASAWQSDGKPPSRGGVDPATPASANRIRTALGVAFLVPVLARGVGLLVFGFLPAVFAGLALVLPALLPLALVGLCILATSELHSVQAEHGAGRRPAA